MAAKAVRSTRKPTRQSVLGDVIRVREFTHGVELGVWQAQTMAPLLRQFPRLHMVGVDRWLAAGVYARKDMQAARAIAEAALKPFGERARLIVGDTAASAQLFENETFDFAFIDASHDADSVRADIRAWLPKIKDGGVLMGHDANLVGVKEALNECLEGWLNAPANVWLWPK